MIESQKLIYADKNTIKINYQRTPCQSLLRDFNGMSKALSLYKRVDVN